MPAPQVGVGVLILRDGKVLLGRRKGSHGAGCWSAPGGHLDSARRWRTAPCAKPWKRPAWR